MLSYVPLFFSLCFNLGIFCQIIFKFIHSYVTSDALTNVRSSQQTIGRKIYELNDIIDQMDFRAFSL